MVNEEFDRVYKEFLKELDLEFMNKVRESMDAVGAKLVEKDEKFTKNRNELIDELWNTVPENSPEEYVTFSLFQPYEIESFESQACTYDKITGEPKYNKVTRYNVAYRRQMKITNNQYFWKVKYGF